MRVRLGIGSTDLCSFPFRCCENCGIRLSRDCIKRQRLKALCKDCRGEYVPRERETDHILDPVAG